MNKFKVKDKVIILTGKDRGKTGILRSINYKTSRAIVEGINVIRKSVKPSQENPDGGFFEKENSVHISNLSLISPKTGKATRVKILTQNNKRVRIATKCGSIIDQ